ncbi:hypothetical protein DL93DRAFT_1175316 [Clavulina sp. PMI_390]|nr:hypothetical protein DL93DRAFT_1175316 [Clavulina sp. PMI_390]
MRSIGGPNLSRGSACVRCRKLKTKCTGLRPSCERCERLQVQCIYTGAAARHLEILPQRLLQDRALEIQLTTNKILLSSKHDLLVLSSRLGEQIRLIGTSREQLLQPHASIPIYVCCDEGWRDVGASQLFTSGRAIAEYDSSEGDTYRIERSIVERTLASFQWVRGEEIPLAMSLYLIGIFLPYRSHFNFCAPLPNFLRRLSLPTSHPSSIHSCLRSACHLAACSVLGGQWTHLEPYFVQLTRHFLHDVLTCAGREHFTQFLWASSLLACYLARAGRVDESLAVITPASSLAMACGIASSHNPEFEDDYKSDQYLLPAPVTETEALDLIWLAYSIFMTDQYLSVLNGCPGTYLCHERWRRPFVEAQGLYSSFKVKMTSETELSKIWQSDLHLNASMTRIFRRVTAAALLISRNQSVGDDLDPLSLKAFIRFQYSTIPQLSDAINSSNPYTLFAHATLYGSSVVLHSLHAGEDIQARSEMLRCSQALVGICKVLQGRKDLHIIVSSVTLMVHMMNALRIFAHELQRHDVRENANLSTEYCHSVEVLLDFLGEMTALYPAWSK